MADTGKFIIIDLGLSLKSFIGNGDLSKRVEILKNTILITRYYPVWFNGSGAIRKEHLILYSMALT
jgi:hypothetical protein